MTDAGTLGERKSAVLRAVVSDYVRTGEPVGSTTLAARRRLGVSSATIRNDMAALEEMGYLDQPHTSAGRIPTDLGYRYFVDALPRRSSLPERQEQAIAAFFGKAPDEPDEVVRRTAVFLSRVTRYGAVAQPPRSEHVFLGGTANIVREESFEHRETVLRLLEALEEEEGILELLSALARPGTVEVRIGRENPVVAMRQASIVVASYEAGGGRTAAIAVIGPTRMQYPEAISILRTVSFHLSSAIERLAG